MTEKESTVAASSNDRLKQDNAKYLWHPMAHPRAMLAQPPDIIARGEGVWIWDIDGHRMIDGMAGLWNCNLGHSNQRVIDAMVAQLRELPYYNAFRGTTHPKAIELSARLAKVMEPENVGAVMFGNGGSDATEGALKTARQYWKLKGQPERTKFIGLRHGYHGVHFGGASAGAIAQNRRAYEPLLPGCFHIDSPWSYRNAYTQDAEELGRICAGQLEREILFQGADTVAAFIAEPVQGAGGVIVPPPGFWPLVREVCDRHGVLLIADEVITGFGRTGKLFGTRLWGVNADIWCLAKGISSGYIPLGATAISARVAEPFLNDESGQAVVGHGYTHSGHPVACAAALASLDEIEERDIPGNAATTGAHMHRRLHSFVDRYRFVGEVRGVGLMACIEMVLDKTGRTTIPKGNDLLARLQRAAYKHGAMVRISGPNMILSPPLTVTPAEVDYLVDVLEAAFTEIEAAL